MVGNGIDKTIYTGSSIESTKEQNSNALGSYYRENRVNLLTTDQAAEFNTYRNWKAFRLTLPKIWDNDGEFSNVSHPQGYGTKSLFSNTAAVWTKSSTGNEIRDDLNMPLLDSPELRQRIRQRTDCTVKGLVEASAAGTMGRAIYNYGDFMYCKYLGRIPNNYLITLRRFPLPCSDHINCSFDGEQQYNQHLPDIGRLVTWMGTPGNEMSSLLSYSYQMPWTDQKAPMNETPKSTYGREPGSGMEGVLAALDGTYAKEVQKSGGWGYDKGDNPFAARLGFKSGGNPRNLDLEDKNRSFESNQNLIMNVKVPGAEDQGLTYSHSISLTFDYELRSYDGVNGRSAMLDLLANILMVTYTQGKFFPGSYRAANMATSNVYANLPIFKLGGNASFGNVMQGMFDSLKSMAVDLGFGPGHNPLQALKNIGNNFLTLMANGLINKIGRPQQFVYTSLISPTPTGQWHLMVGNPKNPILSMGNLCMTQAKIEHYGPLGLDDFPTGLKVTVTLEPAKARDSVAIEQMYMQGNNRIYTPLGTDGIRMMYEKADAVISDEDKTRKLIEKTVGVNGNAKTESESTPADEIQPIRTNTNESLYMRYFGTTDLTNITVAAGEALTGARRVSKNKKDKK